MLAPSWNPKHKELRQFAIISLFGFGLFGAVAYLRFQWITAAYVLWIVGALTFLVGLISPGAVLGVYILLMAIAMPIGWVVSNVLLITLFYLVMTPLGLMFRLIGRDPLRRKKPATESYWLAHEQRAAGASYYRQS